ncbi:MAG: carbamoyl-phosphate synthase small subunit [Deltaproteobacteria bacterium]|nr:carbamoyl-phosphate synthase small subunit [Deltaproteobacteria bacterium]
MRVLLVLEDGTRFEGTSFTGSGEAGGEVIFNTGMAGYQEILTDPSYRGQMVCMTYPLIGNYGVNLEDVESSRVQAAAFIVKECCRVPSNWRATESLPDYLTKSGVMGIEGVDTRALTRHLRIHGAMRGMMSTEDLDQTSLAERARALPPMEGANLVDEVAPSKPYVWENGRPVPVDLPGGAHAWKTDRPRVAVFDFGIKWNILRLLDEQGLELLVVPPGWTADQVRASGAQAVFLSNGPGDPAALSRAVKTTSELIRDLPVGGICLGHQIIGLALGGRSYKLKFGHHGVNHPVKDLATGRIEISSQNHGFCVDISDLDFVEQTHTNLNDDTLEGFRHKSLPVMGVQYHPESAPGPRDSRYFFRRFREMVEQSS